MASDASHFLRRAHQRPSRRYVSHCARRAVCRGVVRLVNLRGRRLMSDFRVPQFCFTGGALGVDQP